MSAPTYKNNVRSKVEQALVEYLRTQSIQWCERENIRAGTTDLISLQTPAIRIRCNRTQNTETLDGVWKCFVSVVLYSDAVETSDDEMHCLREGELLSLFMTGTLADDIGSDTVGFFADFAKVVSQEIETVGKHFKSTISLEIDGSGEFKT